MDLQRRGDTGEPSTDEQPDHHAARIRSWGARPTYVPIDQESILQLGRLKAFADWWNDPVIKDDDNELLSRRDFVLALANKDGGAHIDTLQRRVQRLAQEGSVGWMIGAINEEDRPISEQLITLSPILESVRTIAEEVRLTINNQHDLFFMAAL
jgi:hypothetical protein